MSSNNEKIILTIAIIMAMTILSACGGIKIPSEGVVDADGLPQITPDYTQITIPPNIAPLNFEIDGNGYEFVARMSGDSGGEIIAGGKTVKWDEDEWQAFLKDNRGKDISLEIYVRTAGNRWLRKKTKLTVAEENIDPYFSYRLIEPSFVQYNYLSINQRNLTNFETKEIFNNRLTTDEDNMSCINCHVPRNQYRDRKTQFHVRQHSGGSLIIDGGNVRRINLVTDSTKAGVYQAWHPTEDLIAYSTNGTKQFFFTKDPQKVEVLDEWSDIILYDIGKATVSNVSADPALLETFPAWNPEGTKIYYSVAKRPHTKELKEAYDSIRYDIVSRDFDVRQRKFSAETDTVVNATSMGKSASLARVSPDGRFLLTCMSDFGTFHIWHKNSDLWITDLLSGETKPLANANSDDTDSYHSWSSNSRWVIFSSRRDDGSYTRPYITYITREGEGTKPFVVPQENPRYYRELMKSYNVPEFMVAPVEYDRKNVIKALEDMPEDVVFVSDR